MMNLVNMYFQQMVKSTGACGGDVVRFAGDALIVLWTQGSESTRAHRACECAMELQDALHHLGARVPAVVQVRLRKRLLDHLVRRPVVEPARAAVGVATRVGIGVGVCVRRRLRRLRLMVEADAVIAHQLIDGDAQDRLGDGVGRDA